MNPISSRLITRVFTTVAVASLLTASAFAQSVVLGAHKNAGNGKIIVPVIVQLDDATRGAGSGDAVQAFSFGVQFSPAEAVKSINIHRAGVTAGRSPMFESSPSSPKSASYLASFDEATQPLLLGRNGSNGDIVAEIEITLAADAARGTEIVLSLDPAQTTLGNQAGTIEHSAANKSLELRGANIRIDGKHKSLPTAIVVD